MSKSNHLGLRLEDLARELLSDLGFRLPGEHRSTGSPYGDHFSVFRADSGLCVRAGLVPMDGHFASLQFGREWLRSGKHFAVSGPYPEISRALGIDLPNSYEIVLGKEGIDSCLSAMYDDLARSLPTVMNEVTLKLLEQAETGHFGALSAAKKYWGDEYSNFIDVKECRL